LIFEIHDMGRLFRKARLVIKIVCRDQPSGNEDIPPGAGPIKLSAGS
jgi:hypothetical protein